MCLYNANSKRYYEVFYIVRGNVKAFELKKQKKKKLKSWRDPNEGAWGQKELSVILKKMESLFLAENN
jgi:hypothetical protein